MSLNQIFMWEVSIIIPTNVKYRIISIYNKLFFKVQWNLTSHWNLQFQFSSHPDRPIHSSSKVSPILSRLSPSRSPQSVTLYR